MGRGGNIESQLDRVVYLIIKEDVITASFIQRKLQISYLGAQAILIELAKIGYIEKYKPFKKLKVIRKDFIQ